MTDAPTPSTSPPEPSTTIPELILGWADKQPVPGSFISVTSAHLAPGGLLDRGWRGILIDPDPTLVGFVRRGAPDTFLAICAAIDLQARRLVNNNGQIAAGLHPNELFQLWTGAPPPLPSPRIMFIAGENAGRVLQTFTQWVELDAFALTVNNLDEAKEAGNWLSAGWKVLGSEGLTVVAKRFV